MANVHFVLNHLREHGLRTVARAPTTTNEEHKADEDDDDEIECVDAEFADRAAQIAETQKVSAAKLGGSNKFTIQIGGGAPAKNAKGKRKRTFMDALYAFLRSHDSADRETVLALLVGEHFDSLSVEIDLAFETGNIARDALRADIVGFLRDYRFRTTM